jgi:hypothetical protein
MAEQLHEAARQATGRFARVGSDKEERSEAAEETAILTAETIGDAAHEPAPKS